MFEDDDRRLVQVASIANTIAATEKAAPWRALVWLAVQAESGVLAARLYTSVRTREVDSSCASAAESLRAWRNLADRTEERKFNLLNYYLPTAASTWFVHARDLTPFIEVAPMSDAVKVALRQLVQRYSGSVTAFAVPLVMSGENLDTSSAIALLSEAEKKLNRQDDRLAFCEGIGLIFDKNALLRMPDGVGTAAETLGIARQSLTVDLKAALERRLASRKAGNA